MLLVSGATAVFGPLVLERPDIYGVLAVPGAGNSLPERGRWAADNGCYMGFDPPAFGAMLRRHRWAKERCLWVAAPDVVGDARATLDLFEEWEPRLRDAGYPIAFVAQDGIQPSQVPWARIDAIFIGGSVPWKLGAAAAHVVETARLRGTWVHMGKVNTARRLRYAAAIGVDSVDGSGWSKWSRSMVNDYGTLLRELSEQRHLFFARREHRP
jgi:hypothetical protein